jgi:hypothetical protein
MYSEETQSNENTFWNWFLILVAIVIVWYIFFKSRENLTNLNSNSNPNSNPNPNPNTSDRKMKIIQKIDNVSKAMGDTRLSQYSMEPINSKTDNVSLNADSMYPLLNKTKPQSSVDMSVQSTNANYSTTNANKTSNGSTKLMNKIGFLDGKNVACNMLGVNSASMDDYKKKFYSMYAHQIECPAKCGMKADGMSKGCGMGTKCGLGADCANVNTSNSIPDTFALNYLALDNANKKPCVTCNFKPSGNQLNRQWMEEVSPSYDGLPEDVRIADEARLKKSNLIDANASNYANFKDNVYQDSIGESGADKINEIRTCQDAYGTCKLSDYGNTIGQAYDKLMANPSYTSRNNCDPYQLTGILEDSASTDMYANLQ